MTEQGARIEQSQGRDLSPAAVTAALASQERLAALREAKLLDPTPIQQLDRLTRLAARALRTSIALISVVDDARALLKSLHGLSQPWATQREIPLDYCYCKYVVALREPLIIRDAREEPLVQHSPAIRELGAVSYAGMPLLLDGRHVFGALAAVDTQPRHWEGDDLDLLRELAAMVTEAVAADLEAQRLRTVLAAIPDAVLACDRAGRVISGALSRPRLFGLAPGQSSTTADLVTRGELLDQEGHRTPPEQHPLARALRGERVVGWRGSVPSADGVGATPVLLHAQAIRDAEDEVEGAVLVSTALEQAIDVNADVQAEMESEKDEFLTLVSHELRTPLTSLKMQTQMTLRQLAREGALSQGQMDRMQRALARIERLINSLVEASRMQANELALEVQTCDLQQLCTAAAQEQREATGREIVLDLPDGPCRVRCDSERLGQVLTNLLSNAVKYSLPEQSVRVELRCTPDEAIVYVRDRGSGIPVQALPHLFDRFYRAPQVEVQSGSNLGLGLGLYISRQIIERHGGRMWVESKVGSGSTFAFALPLEHTGARP
jgi:signal transduction histidine kinase